MPGETKTWLVTGATRGIGHEIAAAALASGANVVATGRRPDRLEASLPGDADRLLVLALDVTDPAQAREVVAAADASFGRIDVLVNNAGFGQMGHFETVSRAQVEDQFATNVFGLMDVTRAVLPVMRRQGAGHIINLSSIGGFLGFAGASVYCASKFAVEGLSESLALELADFGIRVTIVEPGFFRTDFLESSSVRYGDLATEGYGERDAALQREYSGYNHEQPGDPAALAELIVEVADHPEPPLRLLAGSDALGMARSTLERAQSEIEAWAAKSASTEHKSEEI